MEDGKPTSGTEARIVREATRLFTERGYIATSMADIAAEVGINRTGLHYYYRTKDRMFQAVFGSVVKQLIPQIHEIILEVNSPVEERVSRVIDVYYGLFKANPSLPMFMLREMQRDFDNLLNAIYRMHLERYCTAISLGLQREMDSGHIRKVPIRFLFMTFYSLLTMPFITKNLCQYVWLEEGEAFTDMVAKWKPYVVEQIRALLEIRQ
jgi:transcriptional regulator